MGHAQSVPWLSGSSQTHVHLVSPSAIPSPLRTDEEEFYYSYYTSPTPNGDPSRPHPYAYATPKPSVPSLHHTTSQHNLHPTPAPKPHTNRSHLSQSQLKTSISTPNLASAAAPDRVRSLLRRRTSTKKGQERWLSAETWWDALLSPSPRFKVKQAPRPHTTTSKVVHDPPQGEPSRIPGTIFPSVSSVRPRAVSVGSNIRPVHPTLARSRSTADLGQPSTSAIPRTGFEPALETLVDDPIPIHDNVPDENTELPLPEPPISLEQVIDEGMAFEQQRAQWKRQASKSIGNRHTRSFSRARSKSLGERHIQGHGTSESNKAHFNLEFLAARSLLGSQSTMPTVHVVRPGNSSSHSKAYSHSHSQSAYSSNRTSNSRVYSHSHSHSLTMSNSSKSSRNPREHSRSGSWSRTAFLKAGSLCGIAPDDSHGDTADELVTSSRVDLQGTIYIGATVPSEGVPDASKVSTPSAVPIDEVGIAISSTPPSESLFSVSAPTRPCVSGPRHQSDQENRWSSKHAVRSSGYAGPHPSAIDSNLPQFGVASSHVSLRHRLPPRATSVYPPINLTTHPYRFALGQPERVGDKTSEGSTSSKVKEDRLLSELDTEHTSTPYPHISLTQADFEQYGVGETLAYASLSRTEGVSEADIDSSSSPTAEIPPHEEHSFSSETVALQHEESDTASMAMKSPPSLTNSTIQMVMSAFNDPDDLDEFQDLFYKPQPISGDEHRESTINKLPTDVHSSASSSPLTHLVRKLSERVSGSSDPIYLQGSESQDHPSNENGTKFVFMNLAQLSPSIESSSQLQGEESTQPVTVVPEDVNSSYTMSVLGCPSVDRENDTFGYPIKHGQLEAAASPSLIQASLRTSTHLSIQDEDEAASLCPVTKRFGLSVDDVIRTSYLTTSDVSRISGLFDFPLPPSALPVRGEEYRQRARVESTPSDSQPPREMEQADGEEPPTSLYVEETLQALRASPVASYTSYRTFGGSDDIDYITTLHQATS